MKNKLLGILLYVMILICLTGCNKEEINLANISAGEEINLEFPNKQIDFTLKENTLSSSGATFILKNNRNVSISYGGPEYILKEENKKWYLVEPINSVATNAMLYVLTKGETRELEINWEYNYGKLPPGKYKMVRDVSFQYEKSKGKEFYVAAEFTLE